MPDFADIPSSDPFRFVMAKIHHTPALFADQLRAHFGIGLLTDVQRRDLISRIQTRGYVSNTSSALPSGSRLTFGFADKSSISIDIDGTGTRIV